MSEITQKDSIQSSKSHELSDLDSEFSSNDEEKDSDTSLLRDRSPSKIKPELDADGLDFFDAPPKRRQKRSRSRSSRRRSKSRRRRRPSKYRRRR